MMRLAHYITSHPERMHFIPFITAGDPNEETTVALAFALEELGAQALEIGIPYSDPLADGPVIQRASARALTRGMTLRKAFRLVRRLREEGLQIPIILFTYYNLLLQLGENELSQMLSTGDIDGLLVPDLPFEESEALGALCRSQGLPLIYLVSPTTSPARLARIGQAAKGFLYCVSSLGVTGMRETFHPEIIAFLKAVRHSASCPIAVGFGISTSAQVEALSGLADGFIVGSAIVNEVEERLPLLEQDDTRSEAIEAIKIALTHKLLPEYKNGR